MRNPLVRFFGLALGLSVLAFTVMFLVALWGKPNREDMTTPGLVVAAILVAYLVGLYAKRRKLLEAEVWGVQGITLFLSFAFWATVAEWVGLR